MNIISNNRKAFHEYTISDKYEAGIALTGSEVKACRDGKVNLSDGWVDIDQRGEAILRDVHIGKYSHGSYANHEETRPRKLLLHKPEIVRLAAKIDEKGYTAVPLKMYLKDRRIKVEIGVARGKQLHDKREATKAREANREVARAMRNSRR